MTAPAPTGTDLLDNDGFRRGWLKIAAAIADRPGFVPARISVLARRDAQLDVMADLLAAHLDLDAVLRLLDGPTPAGAGDHHLGACRLTRLYQTTLVGT